MVRCRALRVLMLLLLTGLVMGVPAVAQAQTARSWGVGQPVDVYNGTLGAGGDLTSVSCPTSTLCVGVDRAGDEVSFNSSGAGTPTSDNVAETPGSYASSAALVGVSCPSTSQCTAVTAGGFEVTFDPGDPGNAQAVQLQTPGYQTDAITCTSTTQCVMVSVESETVFDPQTPGDAQTGTIDTRGDLVSVSCVSATSCLASDDSGDAVTFTPKNPGSAAVTQVFSDDHATSISCTSAGYCTVIDSDTGDTAYFKASSPGSATTGSISDTSGVNGLSCAVSGGTPQCVAVDGAGNVAVFNPAAVAPVSTSLGSQPLTSVSCVSASQCTAVGADGKQDTFDPQMTFSPAGEVVDSGARTTLLSCPSTNQCTSIDAAGVEVTVDPAPAEHQTLSRAEVDSAGVVGLACPSSTQCTTVDDAGYAVTFNPLSPAHPTQTQIDTSPGSYGLDSVACPTTMQCTVGTTDGSEFTFNPQAPGNPAAESIGGIFELDVACPTATQCTLVDGQSEVTLNPQSPSTQSSSDEIDPQEVTGLACPSLTECTAVDSDGAEASFNPQDPPSTPATQTIDTLSFTDLSASGTNGLGTANQPGYLTGVACATTSDCVSVDSSGNVLEGDPTTSAAWATTHLVDTSGLVAVACPDLSLCVALDGSGNISVGRLAPVSTAAPSITGTVTAGDTLSEGHATWSSPPTSYAYQWFDCDANGQNCAAISGATDATYTLAAADVGHTVEVHEVASNAGGTGAAASSAPTAVVTVATPAATGTSGSSGTGSGATGSGTGTATGASAAAIRQALKRVLAGLTGKPARLGQILTHRGFVYRFSAPSAGTLAITWHARIHRRNLLIATVTLKFAKATTARVTLKLTKLGLRELRTPRLASLKVTVAASFTAPPDPRITASRGVTLKRR